MRAHCHGLMCLNPLALVGGTAWEDLGSMAWLEKVRNWGQGLRFQKPMPLLVSFLCFLTVDQDVSSPLLHQCYACLPSCRHAP